MTRFFGIVWVFVVGCTPILDFDALGAGRENEVDTQTQDLSCTSPEDCDDGIECTVERCSEDGFCLEPWPDNDRCGHLEKCTLDKGCVPTGKECETAAECDDEIDCTKDGCVLGKCRHTPDDSVCAPTDPCIVDRICDADRGCVGGAPKSCAGARPVPDMTCRIAKCNPKDGSCSLVELVPGADDDSDGYFDAEACDVEDGAADCDDADPEINPGAEEICDLRDNDCDGLADLAAPRPPEIIESTAEGGLASADLAAGGGGFAVVWQEAGADGQIFARIFEDGGQAGTPPVALAAEGLAPAVVAADDGFFAAWVAQGEGTSTLESVRFSLSSTQDAVETRGDIATLWDGEVRVEPPMRGYRYDGAPRIAFVGRFDDSTEGVVSIPLEAGAEEPWVIGRGAGEVRGFDVAAGAVETAFVVARDVSDGDGVDEELFYGVLSAESREPPALLPFSEARSGASDPSRDPRATRMSGGRFLAAFSDVAFDDVLGAPEQYAAVRGGFLDGAASIFDIVVDSGAGTGPVDRRCLGLATSGEDTGILFSQRFTALDAVTLDFRLLAPDGTRRPSQAGRLARLEDGSELAWARLIPAPSGFAAVWATREANAGDLLWMSVFEGCEEPPR